LRGEKSQTYSYVLSANQGSIWYHFYDVLSMVRSGIEPTTSRSQSECSSTEQPLRFYTGSIEQVVRINIMCMVCSDKCMYIALWPNPTRNYCSTESNQTTSVIIWKMLHSCLIFKHSNFYLTFKFYDEICSLPFLL